MKIGIIGAGAIGSLLAKSWTKVGHQVVIANSRGPETLKKVQEETGATPVNVSDIVSDQQVELIVISIPFKGILKLSKNLFKETPTNVLIVDTCNFIPLRDGNIEEIQSGQLTHSEYVSHYFDRPILKAFNTITSTSLKEKSFLEKKVAIPISGIDTKEVLSKLINQIGFDVVDCGSLENSWKIQSGTPSFGTDWNKTQLTKAIELADKELVNSKSIEQFQGMLQLLAQFNKNNNLQLTEITDMFEIGGISINDDFVKLCRSVFSDLHLEDLQ